MKKRLLIANRGEIAIRIMKSAKKLNLISLAIKSPKEADALYLKHADEIIPFDDLTNPIGVFLDIDALMKICKENKIDVLHPGYGFLSENPDLVIACKENNIVFAGPNFELIRDMGNKTIAKKKAIEANLPLLPGSDGVLKNAEEAVIVAEKIGYPVIVKAAAGGGGRGMRVVESSDEMERNFTSAHNESLAAFNNGDLFVEKYVVNPKHIEFQILADKHGNVIHLGERECSLQRKHQKLIEEAPSSFLSEEKRVEMGEKSVQFAKAIGYDSVGTIEYIMDESANYYFMEMNTRIQVEHPVTEMITGQDLIEWQLRIAMGETLTLKQEDIKIQGWSIECRINAEDAQNRFSPETGIISMVNFPMGEDIRVETGVEENSVVTQYFDSMLAKIVVRGWDRQNAIKRMDKALAEVRINGLKTTIPFCKLIINHRDFILGTYTTKWMEDYYTDIMLEDPVEEMLAAYAAVYQYFNEFSKVSSDTPDFEEDSMSIWVMKRRLN